MLDPEIYCNGCRKATVAFYKFGTCFYKLLHIRIDFLHVE